MLQTLFGLNGRLTRTGFWEVLAAVLLLDVAGGVAAITALEHVFPEGRIVTGSPQYQAISWALFAGVALSAWAVFAAHVKRAHDRGHGAVYLLWVLFPVIGWLWLFYDLGFGPGYFSVNRFGPPPLGHGDSHQAGELNLTDQPPARHGGRGVLAGIFSHDHSDVPPPSAELDWTGAASEDAAIAAARYHGRYDAGEALMRASENHEPPPAAPQAPTSPPSPPPEAFPVLAPPVPAADTPAPDSASELKAAHDDLAAAMGEIRSADQHVATAEQAGRPREL